ARDLPQAQSRKAGLTFRESYDLYVERLKAENRAANTIANADFRHRHLASLDRRNVASISRDEVVTLMRELLKMQKPSSVRSIATLGSSVYGEAIERRHAQHTPFARLRLPTAHSGPKRNLSPDNVFALIDGATDLMRPFVATVAFTGGRISECCGLTWADI